VFFVLGFNFSKRKQGLEYKVSASFGAGAGALFWSRSQSKNIKNVTLITSRFEMQSLEILSLVIGLFINNS